MISKATKQFTRNSITFFIQTEQAKENQIFSRIKFLKLCNQYILSPFHIKASFFVDKCHFRFLMQNLLILFNNLLFYWLKYG